MLTNRTVVFLALALLSNVVLAQNQMYLQLNDLCNNVKAVVPVIALLMFILSGAIYAIGQVMGAETRARATVWSTAMLLGGILGLIIAASAQFLLVTFMQFSLGDRLLDWRTTGVMATDFCGGSDPTRDMPRGG